MIIGRAHEIQRLQELLSAQGPLVAITGDAGVGKSTLAIHTLRLMGIHRPTHVAGFGNILDALAYHQRGSGFKAEDLLELKAEALIFHYDETAHLDDVDIAFLKGMNFPVLVVAPAIRSQIKIPDFHLHPLTGLARDHFVQHLQGNIDPSLFPTDLPDVINPGELLAYLVPQPTNINPAWHLLGPWDAIEGSLAKDLHLFFVREDQSLRSWAIMMETSDEPESAEEYEEWRLSQGLNISPLSAAPAFESREQIRANILQQFFSGESFSGLGEIRLADLLHTGVALLREGCYQLAADLLETIEEVEPVFSYFADRAPRPEQFPMACRILEEEILGERDSSTWGAIIKHWESPQQMNDRPDGLRDLAVLLHDIRLKKVEDPWDMVRAIKEQSEEPIIAAGALSIQCYADRNSPKLSERARALYRYARLHDLKSFMNLAVNLEKLTPPPYRLRPIDDGEITHPLAKSLLSLFPWERKTVFWYRPRGEEAPRRVGELPKNDLDILLDEENGVLIVKNRITYDLKNQPRLIRLMRDLMKHGMVTKKLLAESIWGEQYSQTKHDSIIYNTVTRVRRLIEALPETFIESSETGYSIGDHLSLGLIESQMQHWS